MPGWKTPLTWPAQKLNETPGYGIQFWLPSFRNVNSLATLVEISRRSTLQFGKGRGEGRADLLDALYESQYKVFSHDVTLKQQNSYHVASVPNQSYWSLTLLLIRKKFLVLVNWHGCWQPRETPAGRKGLPYIKDGVGTHRMFWKEPPRDIKILFYRHDLNFGFL